jgi:hypothetical protein
MSTTIDIRELPARWEEVLTLAASGHEVLVTDGTTPRAFGALHETRIHARAGTARRGDGGCPGF